jgi:beta-glucanase (GH16 family)
MTNHYTDANGNPSIANSEGTWTASSPLDKAYHTYGLLWQPGLLVWYVDGVERYRTTVGVPDKDCFITFMLGVYNDNSWTGSPAKTTFPRYMSIDSVTAWQHN